MRALFKKIAKDKKFFNLSDFEEVYHKKPHLVSWLDYFKNDDLEIYSFLDKSIIELIHLQFDFFKKLSIVLNSTISLNGNKFNFDNATIVIEKFIKIFESHKNKIENMKSNINIRGIIEKLKNHNSKNDNNQSQMPATVKNVKAKNFIFEDGIKTEDISLSFKNINNLIKNSSSFYNFEKFKKINPVNEKVSKFRGENEKIIKSDNHEIKEFHPINDSQIFTIEEPFYDGIDKNDLLKLGRVVIKPTYIDETNNIFNKNYEGIVYENSSRIYPNEGNSHSSNKIQKSISNLEKDIRLKERTSKIYKGEDFEIENFNTNLSRKNNLTSRVSSSKNKESMNNKIKDFIEITRDINPKMRSSEFLQTKQILNKSPKFVDAEISNELNKYNQSIKNFLVNMQSLTKSNIECISFIFYFYSILGKKFFKFEKTKKNRNSSKSNQNM